MINTISLFLVYVLFLAMFPLLMATDRETTFELGVIHATEQNKSRRYINSFQLRTATSQKRLQSPRIMLGQVFIIVNYAETKVCSLSIRI